MPRKRKEAGELVKERKRDEAGKFTREERIETKILENIVELQKVHTHLIERFDKLSTQIENLLALFEMSARTLASQPGAVTNDKDKEFLDKIDRLLDQNKVIAKGLTMMEDRIRERVYGVPTKMPQRTEAPAPQRVAQEPQQKPQAQSDDEDIIPSPIQNRPLPRY